MVAELVVVLWRHQLQYYLRTSKNYKYKDPIEPGFINIINCCQMLQVLTVNDKSRFDQFHNLYAS